MKRLTGWELTDDPDGDLVWFDDVVKLFGTDLVEQSAYIDHLISLLRTALDHMQDLHTNDPDPDPVFESLERDIDEVLEES